MELLLIFDRGPAEGTAGAWVLAGLFAVVAFVGFPIGYSRWWRGYGAQGVRLRAEEPRRFALMARGGRAFLPLILGNALMALAILSLNAAATFTSDAFDSITVMLTLGFFLAFAWAVKELVRPSHWIPVPEWVVDYEREAQRTR